MELVVGASEATMKSLLSKLGGLLAQEYTLIRGVNGDLQYINDELASMQSFLRDLTTVGNGAGHCQIHDHRMKDWMKQIRDITYDIEDCVDDSARDLHGLRTDMCCYFLVNSVYEIFTWWPRREIATRISVLKMRAQQISERRGRYGVNNPDTTAAGPKESGAAAGSGRGAGFDAADNQETDHQLVAMKDPVGVEEHMGELDKRVTYIVGFGGVGKTAIATALYTKFGDRFDHRAMVTVSQNSDLAAILRSIKSQVKPQSSNDEQLGLGGGTGGSRVAAAVKGVRDRVTSAVVAKCCCRVDTSESEERHDTKLVGDRVSQGTSAVVVAKSCSVGTSSAKRQDTKPVGDRVSRAISAVLAKCCSVGTAVERQHTKLDQLKNELLGHFKGKSYLVIIDDVWSATTLDKIKNALPSNPQSRIIVTTRFHAIATARIGEGSDIRKVKGLGDEESRKLFYQAFLESKGNKVVTTHVRNHVATHVQNHVNTHPQDHASTSSEGNGDRSKAITLWYKPDQQDPASTSKGKGTQKVPDEVWKMCEGLPLAIVTMAGHVACNPHKTYHDWLKLCSSLFPESEKDHGKDGRKDLTQEEVGRIVSHCYNDMPAEIKTCSLYLSIFPKGHRISRKRLLRRWIAEGFVCEKQGLSVEDVADTYFNHLIRRKIIRPVEHGSNGKVKKFIVHDMVLEQIVAKAGEENFITVVGGNWLMPPPSSKVRRLSLQGSDSKRAKDTEKMNLSHVRSLTMFGSLNQLPSHSFKFGIVQVLDLEGCVGLKQHHAEEICNMHLLKYLSLRRTDTKRIPDKIRKLENLETLDIRETNVVELPKTICHLERLANILGGDKKTKRALKLPEELNKKKKMKALRILSGIEVVEGSVDLHHLTELRKLAIYSLKTIGDDSSFKDLSSSIEYLGGHSLHTLVINDETSGFTGSLDELSTPPKFLVALELSGKIVKLPRWITQLGSLNKLTLSVTALRSDNLKDLSNLDALFSLTFSFNAEKHDPGAMAILAENKHGKIIVPDGGFKSLKLLRLYSPILPLLSFSKNAMPELERLELRFNILEGLFGAEDLAKIKVVHLKLYDKAGEDMTKKLQREMEIAVKRTVNKMPRIILDQ